MAREQLDILLTDHNTPKVVSGDWATGESGEEHQYQLLVAAKGDIKQYPTAGVDARSYWDDTGYGPLINAVTTEYQKDGMAVDKVELAVNGDLNVIARYI